MGFLSISKEIRTNKLRNLLPFTRLSLPLLEIVMGLFLN